MTNPMSPIRPAISLHQPNSKKGRSSKHNKIFRRVRAVFRSFPIITPACKIPVSLHGNRLPDGHVGGTRMTGTLYGHRKARVSLAIQESPGSLPLLLLELTIPTGKLLQDMGAGLVRIALECEKKPNDKTKIEDEPIWTLFCNGRKCGYAAKREPTDEDFNVMQTLRVVSMGAGVIPAGDGADQPADGELTYMRAFFERVAGSKDSETYYMLNPDGNNGPELSLFFVRL
uniref:Protein MIZU-KUSSEI 1 n=1 Tax=Salix viminalis TaxID=40686 RepID=A0A6N2M581_SALVM